MNHDDIRLLHDVEQAETRLIHLIREYPKETSDAMEWLLNQALKRWAETESPTYEFIYVLVWLAFNKAKVLYDSSLLLDFEALEGDTDHENT